MLLLTPEYLKPRLGSWIHLKVRSKFVASVLIAEGTTLKLSLDCTGSDLTACTAREQTARVGAASITIRYVLRQQGQTVLFGADTSNGSSHGSSFGIIGLESCQMDWTAPASQTAISNHDIHLRFLWPHIGHMTSTTEKQYSRDHITLIYSEQDLSTSFADVIGIIVARGNCAISVVGASAAADAPTLNHA